MKADFIIQQAKKFKLLKFALPVVYIVYASRVNGIPLVCHVHMIHYTSVHTESDETAICQTACLIKEPSNCTNRSSDLKLFILKSGRK